MEAREKPNVRRDLAAAMHESHEAIRGIDAAAAWDRKDLVDNPPTGTTPLRSFQSSLTACVGIRCLAKMVTGNEVSAPPGFGGFRVISRAEIRSLSPHLPNRPFLPYNASLSWYIMSFSLNLCSNFTPRD